MSAKLPAAIAKSSICPVSVLAIAPWPARFRVSASSSHASLVERQRSVALAGALARGAKVAASIANTTLKLGGAGLLIYEGQRLLMQRLLMTEK